MKTGDEIKLIIENTASDGRGIGRHEGKVVFVTGAVEGDTVIASIYTVHKTYATAGVKTLLTPSAFRAESFCAVSSLCGGCPLSHIEYKKQLEIKKKAVTDALSRLGGLDLSNVSVSDTKGMETPHRYRNKMVFPVGMEKGKVVGGFYKERSHDVISFSDCFAGEEAASAAMQCVVRFLNDSHLAPYDEKTGEGSIRRVFVRTGYNTKELMVVISSHSKIIPSVSKLVSMLKETDFGPYILKGIILNVHEKQNNLVLGEENITLWGKDTIEDVLMDVRFTISPHSFFQVNPIQTEVLYKTALSLAELSETQTVLDVYCGIGTISLCAAKSSKQVIGVEIVKSAIRDAKENAERNGIENALFYCGAAETVVPALMEQGTKPDVVILDPPRKGSDEKTLFSIISANPERIVYVSCNPATLARDAKFLNKNGYTLKTVVPVDMFPNTAHVETVALFLKV